MKGHYEFDVLIIGSGAAGLSLALQLADNKKIAVLSKGNLSSGSTWLAQGGIAAVLDPQDQLADHYRDTITAGAYLSHPQAVMLTIEGAPKAVKWLIQQGVNFTTQDKDYHLTKEGGHSHRRILHVADSTGQAIHAQLINNTLNNKNIEIFENHIAIDLITRSKLGYSNNRCIGAYILNSRTGDVGVFKAKHIVLATGGASKAYLYTSNGDGASGDGIAMAWRAGCRVANMEFNQFHPTCLFHPQAKSFLISEAVRGEGGFLTLPDGQRFMEKFDSRAELAPRDIVARAIDHEMKRLGCDSVFLDITHLDKAIIIQRFPTIYSRCLALGIDITKEPIPVVPAAHYTCGGVMTNSAGETDLKNLYAIGETAFTGLHGANRLASNSLLECVVYAQETAQAIDKYDLKIHYKKEALDIPNWDDSLVTDSDEDVIISHNWDELRRFMWNYVGIVRTTKRLQRAEHRVRLLQKEIHEYYANYKVSKDLIELRNLATVAELIIKCAALRKESRGLHYNKDYPNLSSELLDSILVPSNYLWNNASDRENYSTLPSNDENHHS